MTVAQLTVLQIRTTSALAISFFFSSDLEIEKSFSQLVTDQIMVAMCFLDFVLNFLLPTSLCDLTRTSLRSINTYTYHNTQHVRIHKRKHHNIRILCRYPLHSRCMKRQFNIKIKNAFQVVWCKTQHDMEKNVMLFDIFFVQHMQLFVGK